MASHIALGKQGEDFAASYLESHGWHILARNWRHERGEVDIIAKERSTIVLVEVKTRRTHSFGAPIEAISAEKLHRLRLLFGLWLQEHSVIARQLRIDVIGLTWPHGQEPVIDHRRAIG